MKSRTLCLFAFCGLIAALGVASEPGTIEVFGQALTEGLEATPIEEILADPDIWAGRKVRVTGEVSGVCSKQGCWMDLTSGEDVTLRIKVDDGVIVFPQDAVGHSAEAEGEVEILEMELEKYTDWLEHVAEEEGREFDPADVGEPPYRIVRLRGSGAAISSL